MGVPNIFKYATKELSQDALICWLVACAKVSEGELRECGLAFIQALFDSGDRTTITNDRTTVTNDGEPKQYPGNGSVSEVTFGPKRQYGKGKIDVFFQASVDEKTVSFVVEDKTHTEMHGDQLKRHLWTAKGDKIEEDFIKPVYFKTGYIFDDERERAKRAGFSVFDGDDMIKFLNEPQRGGERRHRALHEFLRQYADHLDGELDGRQKALNNWDLNKDFVQWKFMLRLRDALEMGPAARPVRRRNRGGSAWTQLPHWDKKKPDDADPRFFVEGKRHLYWRLDSGKPLRLMVAPHVVRKHSGEWTNEKWDSWSKAFLQARKESGLRGPKKTFRRVRKRKKDFVREGLIGAVSVADYLKENHEENKIDRCVQHVVRLQQKFDELIRGG